MKVNGLHNILLTIVGVMMLSSLYGQTGDAKLNISHLTGDFYIYTTYNQYEGNKLPANGMYVVTDPGVVLLDSPWDTTQFQPLLDSIKQRHGKEVTLCLATHWHSDRTEGLEYYRQKGIATYTTLLTDELSKKNHKKRAEFLMTRDTVFSMGAHTFEVYFPGEGHTLDNVVVWFGKEKILYGGCLIKGAAATDLGYLGDANTDAYEETLKRIKRRYHNPNHIIVSHHDWRDTNSLNHSISLARKLRKQHRR